MALVAVSLHLPLSSSFRLPPSLVKLRNPFTGAAQMISVRYPHPVFACHHSLIAFQQQRFRLGVFLLSSQAGAQQALGAKSLPVVRSLLTIELHSRARERLAIGEPAL